MEIPADKVFKVLDHGYVKLLNISGPVRRNDRWFDADDRDPAIAARMSFDNSGQERPVDLDWKLSEYLMKNRHTSPFEMIAVWLEMKLPIFVARQFVRHRTVSINEVSARYVQLPAEWYIPEVVGGKPANAKQGQSDTLRPDDQLWFKNVLNDMCVDSYYAYEKAIKVGVAPEHARMLLHMNHYTKWLWKQDLHNLMHFLMLRDHSHAQIEARLYAQAIKAAVREVLPVTMDLFDRYIAQE